MNSVLLVDEDTIQLGPVCTELSLRGIAVDTCENADDALDKVLDACPYSLIILDIMLPARNSSTRFTRENTADYLVTGLMLAREIRARHASVPIVFYTNHSDGRFLERAISTADELANAILLRKAFAGPVDFGDHIERIIQFGIEARQQRGSYRRIVDSLILEPNFAGLGIDLRKLFARKSTRQ